MSGIELSGPISVITTLLQLASYIRNHKLCEKANAQVLRGRLEQLFRTLLTLGDLRDHVDGLMTNLHRARVMETERLGWAMLYTIGDQILPLLQPGAGRQKLLRTILEGSANRKLAVANSAIAERIEAAKWCTTELQVLNETWYAASSLPFHPFAGKFNTSSPANSPFSRAGPLEQTISELANELGAIKGLEI